MSSRRSALRSVALVLAAVPILATSVAAASPGPAGSAADAARARHEAITRHWTVERMRAAVPRDFAFDAARGFHLVPAAKPPGTPGGGGGGGGGGGTGDTIGASWPNGTGTVYTAVGKVYFEMGGDGWVCSGAVATDTRSGHSIVQTAGHCAYDETAPLGSANAFAKNWMFIPQYDSSPTLSCPNTTFGCWTAESIFVHRGYATAGSFGDAVNFDWAYVAVGPGGKAGGPSSLESLGSFGFAASSHVEGTKMSAFGYPAAGRYKGRDLTYCQGPVFFDPYNDDDTYGLPCNMTGGSSGGPWLSAFSSDGDNGTLSSLNSYGYSGITAMHGPKFGSATEATWQAANTGSLAGEGLVVG